MKKLLLSIAIVASVFLVSVKAISLPEVTDHEKVTIYMFRGHGCSHCYDGLVYLYGNLNKYSDYVEFKAYEVWYNEDNRALELDVAEQLNISAGGVPLFIIGDSYSTAGFGAKTGDEIIEAALKEYQNDNYKDIVAKTIKKGKYSVVAETLQEAAEEEGVTEEVVAAAASNSQSKEKGKYDTYIVLGIFVVFIGAIVALVLSNKRNA